MNTLFYFTGYYCPIGQSIMNPFPCEAGYYCEDGSPDQVECPSGTYQDETTQSSCKVCNEGILINWIWGRFLKELRTKLLAY